MTSVSSSFVETNLSVKSDLISQSLTSNTFKCPYSSEQYRGACQIKGCWARIKSERHASGCAYNAIKKQELGIFDLAYIFRKPRKKIKERLELSRTFLKNAVELIEQIEDNRSETPANYCGHCGRPRDKGPQCMNRIKCGERKEVVEHLLELEFFQQFEFQMKPVEFNLLLADHENRERIAQLFDMSGQDQQHLEEIFQIGENK